MPEYLAPGVFVEEVSFRSKSIEGVPTSTTGFAGLTLTGPVYYPGGPANCEPRLITSFTEYERVFGGLESIELTDGSLHRNYMAHAARAFFDNGGKRLYVSRVFVEEAGAASDQAIYGYSTRLVLVPGNPSVRWRSRWPGRFGDVNVKVTAVRTRNVAFVARDPDTGVERTAWGAQARLATRGSLVEIIDPAPASPGADDAELLAANLYVVEVDSDRRQTFRRADGTLAPVFGTAPLPQIRIVELRVAVEVDSERVDVYDRLSTSPDQGRYIGKVLDKDDPADESAVVCLEIPATAFTGNAGYAAALAAAIRTRRPTDTEGNQNSRLTGGHNGGLYAGAQLTGNEADLDDATKKATGLEALGTIDDIAIVAAPDAATLGTVDESVTAVETVINHAEKYKYRIAVVDAPEGSSINEVRRFRGRFDSTRAALYHPWIEIFDPLQRPTQGRPPDRILLPPCGFVTGIYARSDIERGVHKAPANEVVRGLTRFEANINKSRQEVINPEGINALRFFEGRGNRVWGARTLSSDPEWKYVNVRRLFIYIEHSIDKSTQWAVFEPNNERLWNNIRFTVEDFLYVLWRDGALLGEKPEQAYFVRCDRTTMTQNDLDNGRMICLIGIAPVKPAEFVIFRIGQWTGDAKRP
jgi:hypothetical protein